MNLDGIRHDRPTILILAAALLLFVSPLLLTMAGAAAAGAYILGAIGVAVAAKALLRPDQRDRWLIAAAGAVTATIPWIAGSSAGAAAALLHLAVGAAFLVRAFWPTPRPDEATPRAPKLDDDHAMPSH